MEFCRHVLLCQLFYPGMGGTSLHFDPVEELEQKESVGACSKAGASYLLYGTRPQ